MALNKFLDAFLSARVTICGVILVVIGLSAYGWLCAAVFDRWRAVYVAEDVADFADGINAANLYADDLDLGSFRIDPFVEARGVLDIPKETEVAFFEYEPPVSGWRYARGAAWYYTSTGLLFDMRLNVMSCRALSNNP